MSFKQKYINNTADQRADICIIGFCPDLSRSAVQNLIKSGDITVNGKAVKAGTKLKIGDEISVNIPEPVSINVEAENIPLDIVYEDSDVIVINKARGITVHPANGNQTGTLVNALLYHCSDLSGINGKIRPGIVHRIDKDTTGLLIVAKNDAAHRSLATQIRTKECARIYLAVAEGNIKDDKGCIDAPIGRNPKDRKQMAVVNGGRSAQTYYEVLERFGEATLVKCTLATGRTHQIRVHMKYIGHPLLGDKLYGYKKQNYKLSGQALHAYELHFRQPTTNALLSVNAPVNDEMLSLIDKLRQKTGL